MSESNSVKNNKSHTLLIIIIIYILLATIVTSYSIYFYKENNISVFKYYLYKLFGSKAIENVDTEFIDREQTVYYPVEIVNPLTHEKEQYYVKGRFDALFYNKRTKNLIIIDWKSSGSIDKTASRWTKKLLGPMQDFFELNWVTYTTQLYFYKRALIERYIPKDLEVNDVIVMIVNYKTSTNKALADAARENGLEF